MSGPFRSEATTARDRVLLAMIRSGAHGSDAARALGITRARVQQIWFRETGLPIPGNSKSAPRQSPQDRRDNSARRFWANVRVAGSGCWIWTGSLYPSGYGSAQEVGRSGYAHRVAYVAVKGPIPTELTIDHLCRVRACVNPDHLEAVTQRENTLRSPLALAAINARKTHCIRGHAFTAENTYLHHHGRYRACRACRRVRHRKSVAA